MKLHLPHKLRNSLMACICSVAALGTTLTTGTLAGGAIVAAVAGQAAAEDAESSNITVDGTHNLPQTNQTNLHVTINNAAASGTSSASGLTFNDLYNGGAKGSDITMTGSLTIGEKGGRVIVWTGLGTINGPVTLNGEMYAGLGAGSGGTLKLTGLISGTGGITVNETIASSNQATRGTGSLLLDGEYAAAGDINLTEKGYLTLGSNFVYGGAVTLDETNNKLVSTNAVITGSTGNVVNESSVWAMASDGKLSVTSNVVTVSDATANWTASAIGDHTFSRYDRAVFNGEASTITITEAVKAYSVAVDGKLTLNLGESGKLTLTDALSVNEGGELTLGGNFALNAVTNAGSMTINGNTSASSYTGAGTYSVADNKTFTVGSDTASMTMAQFVNLLAAGNATASGMGGVTKIVSFTDGWGTTAISGAHNLTNNKVEVKGKYQTDEKLSLQPDSVLNISLVEGGSISSTSELVMYKNTNISVDGGALSLASGKSVFVCGKETAGVNSSLTINRGSVQAGGIVLQDSTAALTMNGGELKLGSSGIQATAGSVTLSGGTLGATADWAAKLSMTLGGNLTIADSGHTITLGETNKTTTTFAGTVTNNGKLVLAGTLELQDGATLKTEDIAVKLSENGFGYTRNYFVLAGTEGNGEKTIDVSGATYSGGTVYADGGSAYYNTNSTTYFVNEGTVNYSDITGAERIVVQDNAVLNGSADITAANITLKNGHLSLSDQRSLRRSTITLASDSADARSLNSFHASGAEASLVETVGGVGDLVVNGLSKSLNIYRTQNFTGDLILVAGSGGKNISLHRTESWDGGYFSAALIKNKGNVFIGDTTVSGQEAKGAKVWVQNGASIQNEGDVEVATGGELVLESGSSINHSAYETAGSVTVSGGTMTMYGGSSVNTNALELSAGKLLIGATDGVGAGLTAGSVTLSGGTLASTAVLVLNQSMTVGGVTIGGESGYTGAVTLGGDGQTLTVTGTIYNDGVLTLNGTLDISGATLEQGNIYSDGANGFLIGTGHYLVKEGHAVVDNKSVTVTTAPTYDGKELTIAGGNAYYLDSTTAGATDTYYVTSEADYATTDDITAETTTKVIVTDGGVLTVSTDKPYTKIYLNDGTLMTDGSLGHLTGQLGTRTGVVNLEGAGSENVIELTAAGAIGADITGTGNVTLKNATTEQFNVCNTIDNVGDVTIVSSNTNIGNNWHGTARIQNLGDVTIKAGTGTVTVQQSSEITNNGDVNVETGTLKLTNGTKLDISAATTEGKGVLNISKDATLTVDDGATLSAREIIVSGSMESAASLTLAAGTSATVENGGSLTVTASEGVSVAAGAAIELAKEATVKVQSLSFEAGAKLTLTSGALSFTATDASTPNSTKLSFGNSGAAGSGISVLTLDPDIVDSEANKLTYTTIDVSSFADALIAEMEAESGYATLFTGVSGEGWTNAGQNVTLYFGEGSSYNGNYNLQNMSGSVIIAARVIPEPATATLSLLALAALAARRRRK